MEGFRVGKKDSDVFLYYEIMKDVSDEVFDYTKFDEETSKFIWGKK